jgi:hypothetical protein
MSQEAIWIAEVKLCAVSGNGKRAHIADDIEAGRQGQMRSRCLICRNGNQTAAFSEVPKEGLLKTGGAEMSHRGNGEYQLLRSGVQRAQPFVHGYRECNIHVRVKGGSLAQVEMSLRQLVLGSTCRKSHAGCSEAAFLFQVDEKRNGGKIVEADKA